MMSGSGRDYLPRLFLIDQQTTLYAEHMKQDLVQGTVEQVSNTIPKTNSNDSEMDVKRKRNSFNCFQKVELEEIFLYNAYPTRQVCQYLADRFGTSTHSVKIWFKNRRARQKKDIAQHLGQASQTIKGNYMENALQLQATARPSLPSLHGPGLSPWQQNPRVEYNLNQYFSCTGSMRNNILPAFSFYQKLTE